MLICFCSRDRHAAFFYHLVGTACRELVHAKQCVNYAVEQLRLHRNLDPRAQSLVTARVIYLEVVKNYNVVREKPMNRFPALLLGYRFLNAEIDL
jgi:hypothetical protein